MSSAAETWTNADWIAGLKAGRSDVIAALRARIRRGLAAAFRDRSDVDDSDLDDFTQDAAVRVLNRLDSFRGDSRFATWAMAVAMRVSLTSLRKRRWKTESIDAKLEELASPPSTSGNTAAGERGELLAALQEAIASELTPRQRQVLLAELEGVPQVVLAERLASTPGAIYKVSHDARKRLKAALTRVGYEASDIGEILADRR